MLLEEIAKDVLSEILYCGYEDLKMLDIVYSQINEEATDDAFEVLREGAKRNSFNYILDVTYKNITNKVSEEIEKVLNEYKEAKTKEEIENTDLAFLQEQLFRNKEINYSSLTEDKLKELYDKLEEFKNSKPHTNYLDSRFQNALDETLDKDVSARSNALYVIDFWLKYEIK